MLVLSRKKNERIIIGNEIIIKVVEIKGNRVSLGIVAPDNVLVIRSELLNEERDDIISTRPLDKPLC